MATTLSVIGATTRVTLGDVDVATKINLPEFSHGLRMRFITNAGKFAPTGTDAAAIDSNFETITTNLEVKRDRHGRRAFYLASGNAGTVVEVTAY